jgi:putative ABC transport system permease protein
VQVANLPDAATAVVAAFRMPAAAAFMPRQIDATETLSAASPSFEIARLVSYARPLTSAVTGLGLLLVVVAGIGAAMGLMATMNARARDLALLRALGAGPIRLALVAFAEAAIIAAAALAIGAGFTAGLLAFARASLAEKTGLLLHPHVGMSLIGTILAGTALVAVLAALFPAFRAMHAEIEELLKV